METATGCFDSAMQSIQRGQKVLKTLNNEVQKMQSVNDAHRRLSEDNDDDDDEDEDEDEDPLAKMQRQCTNLKTALNIARVPIPKSCQKIPEDLKGSSAQHAELDAVYESQVMNPTNLKRKKKKRK